MAWWVSLKYIHYNKDWDPAFQQGHNVLFSQESLKYIHYNKDWDIQLNHILTTQASKSLKYIHYNKDWDLWSTP